MSQELTDARACLMNLDETLDEQTNILRVVPPSTKDVFADPYVVTRKCIIREEVEKSRGRVGPSTF